MVKRRRERAPCILARNKKLYYQGIKFYLFPDYVENSLPNRNVLNIICAKEHDFTAVRNLFTAFKKCKMIADKELVVHTVDRFAAGMILLVLRR